MLAERDGFRHAIAPYSSAVTPEAAMTVLEALGIRTLPADPPRAARGDERVIFVRWMSWCRKRMPSRLSISRRSIKTDRTKRAAYLADETLIRRLKPGAIS